MERLKNKIKWKNSTLVSMSINLNEASKEYDVVYEQLFLSKELFFSNVDITLSYLLKYIYSNAV